MIGTQVLGQEKRKKRLFFFSVCLLNLKKSSPPPSTRLLKVAPNVGVLLQGRFLLFFFISFLSSLLKNRRQTGVTARLSITAASQAALNTRITLLL